MKTIIHVNQHVIRANNKTGTRDPVLTVKDYTQNRYAHEVDVLDHDGNVVARVIYRPNAPLACGARVWIETTNKVQVRTTESTGGAFDILTCSQGDKA